MKDINVLLDDDTYSYLRGYGEVVSDESVPELIVRLCHLFRRHLTKEQSIEIMVNSPRDMVKGTVPDEDLDNALAKMLDKSDYYADGWVDCYDSPFDNVSN